MVLQKFVKINIDYLEEIPKQTVGELAMSR